MLEKRIKRIESTIERIKSEIVQLRQKYKDCNTRNEIISILTDIELKERQIKEHINWIHVQNQKLAGTWVEPMIEKYPQVQDTQRIIPDKLIKRLETSIERKKEELLVLQDKLKSCDNREYIRILTEIEYKENDIAEFTNTIELNKQINK